MAEPPQREDGPDAAEVRLNRLLNLILEGAVEALGFDAATVSARYGEDFATIAATDQRYIPLDDAQYDSGRGPCLEALDQRDPIPVTDAGEAGDRWERFSRTASQLGIHSTLSMHLPVESEETAASLNLYSKQRLELSPGPIEAAVPFAEQLAAAILRRRGEPRDREAGARPGRGDSIAGRDRAGEGHHHGRQPNRCRRGIRAARATFAAGEHEAARRGASARRRTQQAVGTSSFAG
jgi:GAF domain-containing protein